MKKHFLYSKFIFSWNIAQALSNAGLVIKIDHWVMANRFFELWGISKKSLRSQCVYALVNGTA